MSAKETFDISVSAEEYEKYKKWAEQFGFESVDVFVEKATRGYLEYLKRKVAKKRGEKKLAEEAKRVELHVTVYEPFYSFMEEYLAFFGSKQTVEELCRTMIYNDVNNLYRELQEFLGATFSKAYIEKDALFSKWPHLSITAFEPKDEQES